jgi:hypothetical protein
METYLVVIDLSLKMDEGRHIGGMSRPEYRPSEMERSSTLTVGDLIFNRVNG